MQKLYYFNNELQGEIVKVKKIINELLFFEDYIVIFYPKGANIYFSCDFRYYEILRLYTNDAMRIIEKIENTLFLF